MKKIFKWVKDLFSFDTKKDAISEPCKKVYDNLQSKTIAIYPESALSISKDTPLDSSVVIKAAETYVDKSHIVLNETKSDQIKEKKADIKFFKTSDNVEKPKKRYYKKKKKSEKTN